MQGHTFHPQFIGKIIKLLSMNRLRLSINSWPWAVSVISYVLVLTLS